MASSRIPRADQSTAVPVRLVGIPIRVSTARQAANDEGSMKTQLQRVRAYIGMKQQCGEDWREVAVYELPGVSGKHSLQNAVLQRLRRDIELRKVNTVLCTDLSRLSRSVGELAQFVDFMNDWDAQFVCLKQNYDTTTPQGRAFLQIMSVLAEFEREMTAERTKDATAARSLRGLWNGGRIFGYDLDPEHKGYLLVNEEEAPIVRSGFETYLTVGSLAGVVEGLNGAGHRTKAYTSRAGIEHHAAPFQISGVQHMLQNWAYVGIKEIGKMRRGKPGAAPYERVPAVWPAIADRDLFDRVRALMKQNGQARKNQTKSVEHAFVLNGGLLTCGACGSPMAGRTGTGRLGKTYFYYACTAKECGIRIVASEIEDAIVERLGILASHTQIVEELVERTNAELQRQIPALEKQRRSVAREFKTIKAQAAKLLDSWGDFDEGDGKGLASARLGELAERKRQLEASVDELDEAIRRIQRAAIGPTTVLRALARVTEIYQCLKPYEQKDLVRLILQKAEVHPREIRLALYSEALGVIAEGLNPGTLGSIRSGSPIRLPALVSQSVVRFESPIRLRSLSKHLQWKKRHAAEAAVTALLQRCPMPPGTPCPKYGSTPAAATCR